MNSARTEDFIGKFLFESFDKFLNRPLDKYVTGLFVGLWLYSLRYPEKSMKLGKYLNFILMDFLLKIMKTPKKGNRKEIIFSL